MDLVLIDRYTMTKKVSFSKSLTVVRGNNNHGIFIQTEFFQSINQFTKLKVKEGNPTIVLGY